MVQTTAPPVESALKGSPQDGSEFTTVSAEEAYACLQSTPHGLSETEAFDRLHRNGPNALGAAPRGDRPR